MTTQLNPPEHRTGRPILDLTIGDARMRETSVRLSLLAILAVALFLRIVFAAGMAGDDDLSIAGRAIAILDHGLHVPLGHYSARLGLTLPLAGIFYVFGVGIAQLMALPMMASLLGIFLSYRIGRTLFDSRVGLLAAAALAFYPLDTEFAGLFFPDLIQGVALAAAFALALKSSTAESGRTAYAIAAGFCWSYAYYVKIDAFFMGFVLLLALALGYVRWRSAIIICMVTSVLVGIEFLVYAKLTGSPLYHVELERRAANEVLGAAGMDNLLIYPKVMFLTVYQTGIHFYLLLAAIVLAVVRRSRPALMLAGWVLIFLFWLTFGIDPFNSVVRLKPQLPRYLLDIAVPMSVLIGWVVLWGYERVSRCFTIAVCTVGTALAVAFMHFDTLNFEASKATQIATAAAVDHHWFPLYADAQSMGIVQFMLHDHPQANEVRTVQHHDFLAGVTTFGSIAEPRAYLLINYDYARKLEQRSLVVPIIPSQFGMTAKEVFSVDNPMPASTYRILRALAYLGGFLPVAALRDHIHAATDEVMRTGDVKIYELERPIVQN
jgi:hypothetical protein